VQGMLSRIKARATAKREGERALAPAMAPSAAESATAAEAPTHSDPAPESESESESGAGGSGGDSSSVTTPAAAAILPDGEARDARMMTGNDLGVLSIDRVSSIGSTPGSAAAHDDDGGAEDTLDDASDGIAPRAVDDASAGAEILRRIQMMADVGSASRALSSWSGDLRDLIGT
jgi:hypothetical protein